ncbi:hypothetical protein [Oerskovia rustica]|uniref:Uncharacterized protein n=1 Tax=Oerskovia rustica TaxID=2762237 RepID=A0ABR8RNR9_9CELL|nr:hypothetical protein [Oerskovia rustica]MBD7949440.1 hypothetical protein [Oerskovia rustica]
MAPTPSARAHRDELFPDHVSTLARTDPELVEYLDSFAFDEVQRTGTGQIDSAYRAKYGNGSAVDHITAPGARATTLRVEPA